MTGLPRGNAALLKQLGGEQETRFIGEICR
jgi:hypothetical protein